MTPTRNSAILSMPRPQHLPFYKWGIKIVGQRKFIMVATDYFTKWAEAKAYAQIKASHLTQFVQRNIICRFGVPHSIISDNGPQFISKSFQQFCAEYGIKNVFSTPRFPQSNGQVEVTSKTLLGYLKRKLTSAK